MARKLTPHTTATPTAACPEPGQGYGGGTYHRGLFDYLGTSPRDALTPYVFSASELPGYYPIAQHCEMRFLKKPPRRLFFCCLRPNDGPGGETPLCDFRKVARDLAPAVLDRFERRGVRIIRNYCGPSGGSSFSS